MPTATALHNRAGLAIEIADQLAAARPVSHSVLAAMTEQPVTAEQFAALCTIRDGYEEAGKDYDTLYSRADQREEFAALSAMTVFPLYYLALVGHDCGHHSHRTAAQRDRPLPPAV